MQKAVGGQSAAAPRAGVAVQIGEGATGLGHHRHQRGHVVQIELRLGGCIDGALRHQHVLPEVAESAHAPHVVGQGDQRVAVAAVPPARQRRERHRGMGHVTHLGHMDAGGMIHVRAHVRTAVAQREPAGVQVRGRHHADDDAVAVLQADQRGPHRHAAHEVLRAVDRVDDPAPAGGVLLAELLAVDRVVGALGGQNVTDGALRGAVGVADRRMVGLLLHPKVQGAEPLGRDRVGGVGHAQGQQQVVVVGVAADARGHGRECVVHHHVVIVPFSRRRPLTRPGRASRSTVPRNPVSSCGWWPRPSPPRRPRRGRSSPQTWPCGGRRMCASPRRAARNDPSA